MNAAKIGGTIAGIVGFIASVVAILSFIAPPEPTLPVIIPQHDVSVPDLSLTSFDIKQASNPMGISQYVGDRPTPCGGPTLPGCDYGYISARVSNTENATANKCNLDANVSVQITEIILQGTPNPSSWSLKIPLQPSDISAYSEQEIRSKIQFKYSGDYTITGMVSCSNGISNERSATLHVDK